MFLCGSNFCGGELSCAFTPTSVQEITYVELKNGIYDDLYITNNVSFELSDKITTGWDFDTILWAKFNNDTTAGNIDWSIDTVSHLLLKRREVNSFLWTTLFVKKIESNNDFIINYNDYTNASGATYEYAIVPYLYGTEGTYSSYKVKSEFEGLFIIEGERIYRTNITNGFCDTTRNIPSSTVEILNKKYPVFVRNSKSNYDTGSCKGSFVPYEEDECSINMNKQNDYNRIVYQKDVMDFIADGIPKILKLFDGRIWLVQTTPNPSDTAEESYNNRYITFTWVEIGNINSEEDLYSLGLSEVTEEWWNNVSDN